MNYRAFVLGVRAVDGYFDMTVDGMDVHGIRS